AGSVETVWLKDATDKRTLSNIDLPDELVFDLTRRSETLNLNLRRNYDINPNTDVYFARKSENGELVLEKSRHREKENLAYYQDIENGAFMTVRCVKRSNEQCDRIINGNIRIGDIDYALQPAETDASSRYVLEDPDVLGRQYVLQVETHPLREHSFENEDASQEMDKNTEQRFMTLLRRFQKEHRQKHVSPAVLTLSSTNVSTLYNSGERDKSRKSPRTYHVKVAVVIDISLWTFYVAAVHPYTERATQLIHQYYSHVMNGVNMLYKGIADPSIRINVILERFIIWKSRSDFRHVYSTIIHYKDQNYIKDELYLYDIITWDNATAVRGVPSFSHGMVFTKYKLYEHDLDVPDSGGLCYEGEVCNIGRRMSIVETRGSVWTIRAGAHELAHSLGAPHDGEREAKACKPEESFIMTPILFDNSPRQPYNKNSWIFSTCSIDAFKRTLPNKDCVRDVGRYFNDEEYHKYSMEVPGVVFPVNRQCELINGQKSILCKTARKDVCLLMRCTDPRTGDCLKTYHGAARGTECGTNKSPMKIEKEHFVLARICSGVSSA
ncbi:hypothetical protein ACJMK2_022247, partial [Sinanodonta woodiana]